MALTVAHSIEKSTPGSVNYKSTINSPSRGCSIAIHTPQMGFSRLNVFGSAKHKQIEKWLSWQSLMITVSPLPFLTHPVIPVFIVNMSPVFLCVLNRRECDSARQVIPQHYLYSGSRTVFRLIMTAEILNNNNLLTSTGRMLSGWQNQVFRGLCEKTPLSSDSHRGFKFCKLAPSSTKWM